ncbi:nuclear RNA export factor 1-like [Eriocheir sinensis]|uniref:nuclear RNA export factor 1-like n=1 Tax=Eriocheir sinensis TaxID=95602 RepID=UPI0021CA0A0C|nr:nuclear RNA export factor 1-like [Eriocheir sinensis]XP_050727095.1 nuclear RNA export factor 1-like [Eriocheir sinensis]XP_050727096.1 nuclear RNA export factor 1-like [Eriocheir sinensis]
MGKRSRHRFDKKKKAAEGFLDEDEIMALNINGEGKPRNAKHTAKLKKRFRKLQKREKEKLERSGGKQKQKSTGWHKIEVIGSEAMEKNFIYTSIGSSLEIEFQPLGFHKIDKKSCFYLENNEPAASAMHSLDKRIQDSNGNLLKINSIRVSRPDLALNSDQLQVLREVMSRRFNAATCLLDLTNLHHDPALLEKDILAPLASTLVMKQVIKVIKENIPHLKALNLSKNSLHVNHLNLLLPSMHSESSQLFALNLEHNAIDNLQMLRFIKMFPITELSLQFNPIVEIYKNKPIRYIELAKKNLPQLKILDTVDVETYLKEKIATASSQQPAASSSTAGTSSSIVSEPLVRSFLEQYYALIDAPDRNALVAAYTPDAVLEIKSSVQAIISSVFVGQDKIKEALTTFPRTQHQHGTFSFNIQFPSPSIAQAAVMGQCQIDGLETVVTFARTMNIVPFNAGLCCSQDVLELR